MIHKWYTSLDSVWIPISTYFDFTFFESNHEITLGLSAESIIYCRRTYRTIFQNDAWCFQPRLRRWFLLTQRFRQHNSRTQQYYMIPPGLEDVSPRNDIFQGVLSAQIFNSVFAIQLLYYWSLCIFSNIYYMESS